MSSSLLPAGDFCGLAAIQSSNVLALNSFVSVDPNPGNGVIGTHIIFKVRTSIARSLAISSALIAQPITSTRLPAEALRILVSEAVEDAALTGKQIESRQRWNQGFIEAPGFSKDQG
jgi:hypothetical protein